MALQKQPFFSLDDEQENTVKNSVIVSFTLHYY